MPAFVASTTESVVTAFVDLFTDMITMVVTDLWPYLLGIAVVLVAYRAGRRLLRI